jgi:hypothetical protein
MPDPHYEESLKEWMEIRRAVERLMSEGRSAAYIKEKLNISDPTYRRALNYVQGVADGEKRATGKEVREDEIYSPTYGRAVSIITDSTGLVDSKPIRVRGGRRTSLGTTVRIGTMLSSPEAGEWRLENIDSTTLRDMSPADLLPKILRVSPEMSRALYDLLRMANSGWQLKAVQPNTRIPDDKGQQWLDLAIKTLDNRPGKTANTTWNSLLTGIAVRGMLFTEIVLSPKDARTFVDIVTPDPYTVRFRAASDPDTGGQGWELVQGTGRNAIPLNEPTIKVVSVDPLPDTPYGTPPLAPGLFPCLFIMTMFQDARRVVAQQGWPRLDIMVKVAEVINTMKREDQGDPKKVQAYVQQAIDQIADSYSNLDPDQAWVHTDTVEFKSPIGAIGDLEGVGPLFAVLERMAVRALKSMPLLMGMPEGVSEANANRQWEVHVASIRAIQSIVEAALSSLFTLYLEANGVNAQAVFKFNEMRAIEELREAQTFFQMLENAQMAEVLGYYEHDEASMYAVGHPAAQTDIGVVGNKDTGQGDGSGGKVGAGDTGDEKPIQGNDGAKKSALDPIIRTLSMPSTAHGLAYGMALLRQRGLFDDQDRGSGRDVERREGFSVDASQALSPDGIRTAGDFALPDGSESEGSGQGDDLEGVV